MEGILLNVKNTDGGSGTAALCTQALRSKKIFVFGELLECPQVQKMRQNTEVAPVLNALEIFAYGTFSDYAQTKGLPELNEAQVLKLRQLTVISLASKSKWLDYSLVMKETGLNNVRAVEDLVISCVYDGLLKARIDQRNTKFLIQWCASRDVRPAKIDEMLQKFATWSASADGILRRIDQSVESAARKRQEQSAEHKLVAEEAEHMKTQVMKESSDSTIGKLEEMGNTKSGGSKRGGVIPLVSSFMKRG